MSGSLIERLMLPWLYEERRPERARDRADPGGGAPA
jgi:hypothetical protein